MRSISTYTGWLKSMSSSDSGVANSKICPFWKSRPKPFLRRSNKRSRNAFTAVSEIAAAFADFLPELILTRKKMGFNVPLASWFQGGQRNLISRLLLSERACSRGFLNDAFVARLLRDHLEGRTNYQAQLFILASLELWFRVFIDSPHLECPRVSVEELLEEGDRVPSL